jgi:hypothetical protein
LLRVNCGAEAELVVVRVEPAARDECGRRQQRDDCERFEFGAEGHNLKFEI